MTNRPPSPPALYPITTLGAWLLGLAIVVALGVDIIPSFFLPESQLSSGEWYLGGDTYMRMVRVREWLEAGSWYQSFSARSNAPYGEVLHWTRPMDVILVLLAAPLMPFVGLGKALYIAGFIISPIMMALTLWAFVWGTRRILDTRGQIILVVLFAFQPITHYYYAAARPDHHAMILLAFAAVLAFLVRFATDPEGEARTAAWAGVIAALGIWISVESLTIELFALLALGLMWVFTGRDAWLDALRRFTLAGALTVVAALMIERAPDTWLSSQTYDRLSTVHVVLLALIALGVEAMRRGQGRFAPTLLGRLLTAMLAAGAAAAILGVLYPDFFKGPFGAAMDPRLDAMWLSKVNEFQPLIDPDRSTIVEILYIFAPLAWGAIWAVIAWRNPARGPHLAGVIVVLALSAVLFAPLAMVQARWGGYMGVAVSLPWALLLTHVLDWRGGPLIGPAPGTPVLRAPVFLLIAVGHIVLAGAYYTLSEQDETPEAPACEWRKIAPFLNSTAFADGKPQTLLNHIHTGPEILYRTPHRVIGTPYHRNTRGLLDTFTVLAGTDLAQAKGVLQARQVDFVLLCVDSTEERLMLKTPGDTLMRRLIDDRAPAWLEKAPLPDGLERLFRFYRFVPEN